MKTGSTRTLQELAAEVERQRASAVDLVAATPWLTMLNASELHVEGQSELQIGDLAHKQIADERGIPRLFYERLQREHRGLLDHTVNTPWREKPSRRLIRILDGKVRADLSSRWRPTSGVNVDGRRFPRRAINSRRRTYTRDITSIAY
ncbi:MAG: hypothetical protein ACREQM_18410 [Candidatus Dormibacteraceae bacterium]